MKFYRFTAALTAALLVLTGCSAATEKMADGMAADMEYFSMETSAAADYGYTGGSNKAQIYYDAMEAPMEMAPIADGNLSDRYYSGTTQNGSDEWKVSGEHFLAIVVEAHGHYLLVEPLEDEWEHSSAKRIEVPIPNPQDPQEFTPGDLLRIYYSGTLRESYPAQAVGVIGIERLG